MEAGRRVRGGVQVREDGGWNWGNRREVVRSGWIPE